MKISGVWVNDMYKYINKSYCIETFRDQNNWYMKISGVKNYLLSCVQFKSVLLNKCDSW